MSLRSLLPEPGTPAELFMSRYQWLMRWAMQFTRNDKTAAEDLIQDTFLRFCQANLNPSEIRDVEAMLYTYLQHVHLSHIREVRRHSFVSLGDAKLDALALGLFTGPDEDRIETQNALRRIAAYVAWRKQTSKSASIVALRFFHGYLPEEIARIALVSREAVDERLHKGRNDIRLHLLDAEKLREAQHGGPVASFPSRVAASTDELLRELVDQLFRSSHGACMSAEQLALRYRKAPQAAIPRDLLAHIVSCRSCLAVVDPFSRRSGTPPAPRATSGLLGMAWRGGHRGVDRGPWVPRSAEMKEVLLRSERRLREIFEHRPNALIVAVNGRVLASRDVGATFNGLKVEVSTRDLRFIEVLNEYGVSLLSWVVESMPPHSEPVAERQVEFSMGRKLDVDLQYSAQSVVIEVQYYDPSYREAILPSISTPEKQVYVEEEARTTFAGKPSLAAWVRINAMRHWPVFSFRPLFAASLACALIIVALGLNARRATRLAPQRFMQQAAAAERLDAQRAGSGVVVQEVKIHSGVGDFDRLLYRDPLKRRHMKGSNVDQKMEALKKRFVEAGIEWDDPLSAASFQQWHASQHVRAEAVASVSGTSLSLRVDTDGSDVEQETITLRTSDWHPIARTAEFRDHGTVEIAELNYAVLPWGAVNQNLFDGDTGVPASSGRALPPPPRRPSPISEGELDLAELQVRAALHDLNADSNGRLIISHNNTGVLVGGLVDTDEQRSALEGRLNVISHVATRLRTVSNAPPSVGQPTAQAPMQMASVVAEPSLLEKYLLEKGQSREAANELTESLFSSSTALLHAEKRVLELQRRFPPDTLSPEALELYERLLHSWYSELDAALRRESETIEKTGIAPAPLREASSPPGNLDVGIESNRVLLKQLIGHDGPEALTAPALLAELAHSVDSIRNSAQEQQKLARTAAARFSPLTTSIHN